MYLNQLEDDKFMRATFLDSSFHQFFFHDSAKLQRKRSISFSRHFNFFMMTWRLQPTVCVLSMFNVRQLRRIHAPPPSFTSTSFLFMHRNIYLCLFFFFVNFLAEYNFTTFNSTAQRKYN